MESSESSEPHTHLRDWLEGLSRVGGKGGRPCGCWGTRQNKALCTQLRAPWIVWGKAFTPLDAHVRMTPAVPDKQPGTAQPPSLKLHTLGVGAAPWKQTLPPGPSQTPGAGLGVPGSHQVGSRIPPHHRGKLPKPMPVSRPADEPAFLLPSSRQVPGGLSAGPRSDQTRSHPHPGSFPPGIPVHGHLLGPGGLRTPEGAGPAEPRTPSPLSKSISSSVCCTPGAALGWEQQGPSAQGRGAAMSLSAPAHRPRGAGAATGRHGRGLSVPPGLTIRRPHEPRGRPIKRLSLGPGANRDGRAGPAALSRAGPKRPREGVPG